MEGVSREGSLGRRASVLVPTGKSLPQGASKNNSTSNQKAAASFSHHEQTRGLAGDAPGLKRQKHVRQEAISQSESENRSEGQCWEPEARGSEEPRFLVQRSKPPGARRARKLLEQSVRSVTCIHSEDFNDGENWGGDLGQVSDI